MAKPWIWITCLRCGCRFYRAEPEGLDPLRCRGCQVNVIDLKELKLLLSDYGKPVEQIKGA